MDAARLAAEAKRCNDAARAAARAWMLVKDEIAGGPADAAMRAAIRECMDASGVLKAALEPPWASGGMSDEERLEMVREGVWANS